MRHLNTLLTVSSCINVIKQAFDSLKKAGEVLQQKKNSYGRQTGFGYDQLLSKWLHMDSTCQAKSLSRNHCLNGIKMATIF